MDTLTENQKFISMALTNDWLSSKEIKKQATKDGASGTKNYGVDDYEPVQRVQWSKLTRLQVAEQHPTKNAFRRGQKWEVFKDRYGDEPTQTGSDSLDVARNLDELDFGVP